MEHVVAIVLAAGTGSRFGGGKLLAPLSGKPILQHVLDALTATGVAVVVVVVGDDHAAIEAAVAWRAERLVRNHEPRRGLASSLRAGVAAAPAAADAVLVVLGDQPALGPEVVRALLDAPVDPGRPVVVPRYAGTAARNPVLVRRGAFGLFNDATGDRGLGPILDEHPGLVLEVPVAGANPDVDRPADLTAAAAARWAARVRADRDQVDRIREVADGTDFYAPVTSIFRADPDRTDDPVLDALRELVESGETWLDIGAGAGRYALPLARVAGRVIALDPSPSMLEALTSGAAGHGIRNVEPIEARWPAPIDEPVDVALIAHVGYDIEDVAPFLDAMDMTARRLCVAVLMDAQPSAALAPLWPAVHGEPRVLLPGLGDLVELLHLRGREPSVRRLPHEPRRFGGREELLALARRQLWVAEGSEADRRLQSALPSLVIDDETGLRLAVDVPGGIGVVTWTPGRR